ncbi:MAG: LytTR family DNA-binding domain-containing protein [Lachnospiraceae bacterium]|nr:LytTR family DNA-binding domain-containing protein [Lachnospiraceae bacterium]
MKLKIAVCDDDTSQRRYLLETVSAWTKKNRHPAELREYADAKSFFFDYGEEKDFDILLLDVEMPGMSGIELAREVRRENSAVQIVFITGYYEYFGDGFDVSALHYLIKPVDAGRLGPVLDRAADNLAYRERSVLLSTADGSIKVPLADILYVESENVYIIVHTARENYRTRMALRKFEEQLDETFFKVHRSFVVGLRHVKKITRTDVTMTNGDVVPLSRGVYDAVHAALIRYL